MRCQKHHADLSSNVGVCATCLRDRLLAIIAAQSTSRHGGCRKVDPPPPPLSFPRSVSPYISRRKSDITQEMWQLGGAGALGRRFYSTPQVGPTGSVYRFEEVKERKGGGGGRLSSLFGRLFRSKSGKSDFDSGPISDADLYSDSQSSWFSGVFPGGRRKKEAEATIVSAEGSATARRQRARRNRDRGMSPARFPDEEDVHCYGGSSGYSSESWQTPRRTPAAMRRGGRSTGSGGNYAANLTFCLSPLVRASPNQRQKGIPPEMTAADSRVPPASSFFHKNRSRKLADLGRYSYN